MNVLLSRILSHTWWEWFIGTTLGVGGGVALGLFSLETGLQTYILTAAGRATFRLGMDYQQQLSRGQT